jgi:hypothetical protein
MNDCMDQHCCVEKTVPLGANCEGDFRGNWTNSTLSAGRVHPRQKDVMARRLAQAAFASVYAPASGPLLSQGPVLAGCSVSADGASLTLRFDAAALKAERMTVSKPALARALNLSAENTALYVLAGAQLDLAAISANHHNATQQGYKGPYASGNEYNVEGWRAVMPAEGAAPNEILVDLFPLGGAVPTAVRYGAGAGSYGAGPGVSNAAICCGPLQDVGRSPCPPGSCPIKSSATTGGQLATELPAAPFVAAIVGGRCVCALPQVCSS